MSFAIGPTPPPSLASPLRPAPAPVAPAHPARAALEAGFEVDLAEVVPAAPPAAVSAEVRFAAQRAAQLAADDRELHFTLDEETGRVIVQVRDLAGTVLRTIPSGHALDVITGVRVLA